MRYMFHTELLKCNALCFKKRIDTCKASKSCILTHCAATTSASLAVANAATKEPSCSRSLVPYASRCSTSAMASTSAVRTLTGMPMRNTHLRGSLSTLSTVLPEPSRARNSCRHAMV